jgi:high-affinity nickel-transport protein
MMESNMLSASALGLIFILGLRHGLDPDHVAVIDNITFRAADERPSLAPWTGTLFALGHSSSVAAVALTVSLFTRGLAFPPAVSIALDCAVIALLLLVGTLNLRALMRPADYRPVGWRSRLVPKRFRESSRPGGVVLTGVIFGLVFDTATQAAAWGAAASATGGIAGAAMVALAFGAGMILVDTADSWTVARLLRRGRERGVVARYRRGVGWLIVALSFGTAAYGLVGMLVGAELHDDMFTFLGIGMAVVVTAALLLATRPARPRAA